ncbi:MAG: DNA-binding domain-containing protein [bacterium]|nr:DNA-binding domain-containing protein [bacterium]MDE0417939.1 DNA-binding domain-containing protein [bacterium]
MPDSQSVFAKALLDPSAPVPEGLLRPDGAPAARRFDIYRNNVVASLVDALADSFGVTHAIVGRAFFRAMAGEFVRAHPPRTPCVVDYGDCFPDFIEAFEPAGRLPYLGDVARLEVARRRSFHAADDDTADPGCLAGLDEETLLETRMNFRASTAIVRSSHPLWSIWRHNTTDDTSPVTARPEDVLVSRPADSVLLHSLPPGSADFLENLARGDPLGEAAHRCNGVDLAASLTVILDARAVREIVPPRTEFGTAQVCG